VHVSLLKSKNTTLKIITADAGRQIDYCDTTFTSEREALIKSP
jgi:hypothetical protein